jgi:hypothetical protein
VAQLKALQILLDKSLFSFFRIPSDAKARMLEEVNWLFEKNKLTEQVMPRYRKNIFSQWFYGPRQEFDNLLLGEFHFSEMHYREYVVDQDEEGLNKLIAVLYRKPIASYNYKLDSAGDARIKFNANEIDFYAKKVKRWPLKVKLAILTFYDGCREDLMHRYNDVFQGGKGEDNDQGMFGVIRGLSGPKYGKIDDVEELNIHTALTEISMQLKEAKELETASNAK